MSLFPVKKTAGFSLVELMVVVGIIGILAAIAVPKLQMFSAKAKRTEAMNMLRQVHTFETSYFAENSTYTPHWNLLAINPASLAGKYYLAPTLVGGIGTTYHAWTDLQPGITLCPGVVKDVWFVGDCNDADPLCQVITSGSGRSAEELFSGKPAPFNPSLGCQ